MTAEPDTVQRGGVQCSVHVRHGTTHSLVSLQPRKQENVSIFVMMCGSVLSQHEHMFDALFASVTDQMSPVMADLIFGSGGGGNH